MTHSYAMQMKLLAGLTRGSTFAASPTRDNPVLYIGGPMHGRWKMPEKNSQIAPLWPESERLEHEGKFYEYGIFHWDIITADEKNDGKEECIKAFFYRLAGLTASQVSEFIDRHATDCTLVMLEQRDNGKMAHPMHTVVELDREWAALDRKIEKIALDQKQKPSQRASIALAESADFIEKRIKMLRKAKVPEKLWCRGGI